MEQKVERFIQEYKLLDRAVMTGVGVSGGIDSMTLLFLLNRLGYPVAALHYEHGIRGEASQADAEFVRRYCEQKSIPFLMENGDVPQYARKNKIGLEAAARALRYEFFVRADVETVATAHHMDDQAETVLMNIVRGCGIHGLAGMEARSGNVVRPFLCVSRTEIEAYAAENGIPYRTDSTNDDVRYTRNRVRHRVLEELKEMNPSVCEALLRLSENARDADRMIVRMADKVPFLRNQNAAEVDAKLLRKQESPVAAEVLMRMCEYAGGRQNIERCHILAMLALNRTGAEIPLKNGLTAKYEYGALIIYRKSDRIENVSFCEPLSDLTVFCGGSIRKIYGELNRDNRDKNCESFCFLPKDAVVRIRRKGDVFAPFGSGEKKLKDFMIDQKIPREKRDRIPLVAVGDRIIWVVGYAISRDFAVSDTNEMITLAYKKG